ncbi:hypothetical protein OSB04_un001826 [Centaurea solstitialis]|uniref:Uncharacterized protein n=1 Tax=Centaurea solstitialis TaxID=347529 RepID=A0AA38SFH0_9ASTR|nr:hypothetical protein OSB04_un001826 [Centaurea solstitialis]
MVQHEEYITGGRTKKVFDPLALSVVPFGGPNSASIQPTPYNNMPLPHHPEDFNHEFNPNFGQGMQHPDDPMIITISDEELVNMNESLALISHNVQRLNANRGFTSSRGSGFHGGNRMGQGRGRHHSVGRSQFSEQRRGGYQQGDRYRSYDQGRNEQFPKNINQENPIVESTPSESRAQNHIGALPLSLAGIAPEKDINHRGFPHRKTRAEFSAQIFRVGNCIFSESENSPFPNRKTLFSESENESLTWGLAPEKSLFQISLFPHPNFSESENCIFQIGKGCFPHPAILSQIRIGKHLFPSRISPL